LGKLDKAKCPKHGEYAPWLRFCPECGVTKRPNNVTPVTKGHPPLAGIADDDCPQYIRAKSNTGKWGRPKKYASNAARQRAYRGRKT